MRVVVPRYISGLDGLRAIAILIVLFAHADAPFPRSGGVGVDIFFVLSGFLITRLLCEESVKYGRIHVGYFYMRRILRLTPCLLLTTLLFAIVFHQQLVISLQDIAIALTYTANWARAIYDIDLNSFNHYWSLAIEEQFYLVWPLVITLLAKWNTTDVAKAKLLLVLAILLAVYRAVMVDTYSASRIYFALDTHMDGLVIGAALAYYIRALEGGEIVRAVGRLFSWIIVPVAMMGLLGMMVLITWKSPWMGYLGYFFAAVVSALVIADLLISNHSLLRPFLSHTGLVQLGKISYGVYLLHYPIFKLIDIYFALEGSLSILIKISSGIVAAIISYYLMEVHFLRMKKRFTLVANLARSQKIEHQAA